MKRYKFIGKDGSLGYRTGKIYWLIVNVYFDGYVQMSPLNPRRNPCPYSNIDLFKANWKEQ